jgi:hypothetical protein
MLFPLLAGAVQETFTLVLTNDRVGAVITAGTDYGITDVIVETGPHPYTLQALSLNLYYNPEVPV